MAMTAEVNNTSDVPPEDFCGVVVPDVLTGFAGGSSTRLCAT